MAIKCPKCQSDNPDTLKFCGECGTQLIPSAKVSVSQTKTLETETDELTRGTVFAEKYEIIEELGKGGMGRVYRAYDKKIEDEVALKLIKPEIAADGNTIKRFRNELRLARKIGHRNVCKMYDLNEEEGTHYITMEYVSGEDLKNMIRMTGQLSVETAVNIGKQICEGLAEAHHLGVVHRDLKPQNIMIDKKGNARIMDFGIARSVKARGITGTGMMIGTPEYMSPEQAEGKDIDQRSDIYSLGIILYEMVTGKVPFKGETPLSVVMKHKSESPRSPKEINAQIPQGLSHLILKCLEKNKEERFQNVEELLSELDKIGVAQKEKISVSEWKNSIAVLPFADLSPQKDQEYFCDGIAEEIINALTKIKNLRVVARTSSFSFKDTKIDVREIGRRLNVEKILEGSLRKAGNRLRITAQLINVEDGYHIWSERYDRDLDDVFAIQDDVTLAIVDNLKVKLLKGERVEQIKRHSKDLEAYNFYLKGSYFWNKRTAEGLNRAIKCFQEAIEKDPDYALAYAGLADSYLLLTYYSSLAPQENFAKAKAAAERALELNDNLAEVHTTLALAKIKHDRDWEGAEKEYQRALELNPNYAKAHFWYAWYLMWTGRINEALEETQRAHELDPLSLVINSDLGLTFFFARQHDQAIEQFNKTFEIEPDYVYIHLYLGWAYLQKSMNEEALAEILKERELLKDWNPLVEAWVGVAYVQIDKIEKAREILDELIKRSKKVYVSPYHVATVYFALGENDQGFQWLNKAYKEKDYWLLWLKIEPFFDIIRQDPRYKELLKKMGLLNE